MSLPSIRKAEKLPRALSTGDMSRLLSGCADLRSRAALGLLYSAGLRGGELRKLEPSDIDSGRMLVHVRQGKGNKDRYVPLSRNMLGVLRDYVREYRPAVYLFNTAFAAKGEPVLQRELSDMLAAARARAGLERHVTCHTLRHSYATHLLEMGENILAVQKLLGHGHLKTTLSYLHVANMEYKARFSPLDVLFDGGWK